MQLEIKKENILLRFFMNNNEVFEDEKNRVNENEKNRVNENI